MASLPIQGKEEQWSQTNLPFSPEDALSPLQGWNDIEGLAALRQDTISLLHCEPSLPRAARQGPGYCILELDLSAELALFYVSLMRFLWH